MPNSLRSSLLDFYQSSLPGHLQVVNTACDEDAHTSLGQAIHFDWYNRYSTMVSVLYQPLLHLFIKQFLGRWSSIQYPSQPTSKTG
jgi:hypothetical protein